MGSPTERWQQIESLFYEAVELEPAARASLLDSRCGSDADLRQEVESLLASADQPLESFEKPIQQAAQQILEQGAGELKPGTRFARYEVLSKVGSGGMGQVYVAYDPQLKRKVAIKLIAPDLTRDARSLQRFELEAQAASALNHPNILTVYEFGQHEGRYYLATEYIEGKTLRESIRGGPIDLQRTTDISLQITSALAAAHARGIVHRDIKPDNVIVREDGIVKVLDFGIAKLSESPDTGRRDVMNTKLSTSRPGAILGTVRYMSPEQARGHSVDGRSDLFSLGVVIYEMVTGHVAFPGDTASDVIAEILKGEPDPLTESIPGVSAEFEAIVTRSMRKSRDERYQSANEMHSALETYRKDSEFREKLSEQRGMQKKPDGAGRSTSGLHRRLAAGLSGAILIDGDEQTKRWPFQAFVAGFVALAILALIAVMPSLRRLWVADHSLQAATHTLAVLPFRNLHPDPQTDFLGFSLADAIITKLGYVGALTVRPSSSVDKYRNQSIDPQQAGEELHVDTLLTGSFLRDGDDLRITAQLIDVKPDKILWQDTIDMKYDRLLTVQDTVSQQILKGLAVKLSPSEVERLKPERNVNSEAYEYYLRGVDLYSLNDFAAAIRMLEKSTAIDPNYAPAWAHLGRTYTTNASLQFGGREQYAKAQAAYEKAIALDPSLTEVRVYMANMLTDTGRVEQAVPLMREVLAINPRNAEAHWELGYAYRFGGALEESARESELARQNDPSVKRNSSAMNAYLYLGEYNKFLQSLPSNDSMYVLFYHGFGEYHVGNREQAQRDFDRAYELDPTLLPANVGKALSYGISGEPAKGLELLKQTEQRILNRGVGDAESMYKVAQAYSELGDKVSALDMLRSTIEGGFFPYPYFQRDPLLNNIRQEPEFATLMNQARQRYQQFEMRFFPGATS
jgi:serine/threonine-protein kinase